MYNTPMAYPPKTENVLGQKMTVKQKKFVKEYVRNGGNGTQAALKAYDTTDRKAASVIATENLAKLSTPISQLLDKHGLTDDRIAQGIAEGAINAEKPLIKGDKVIRVPDHAVRHRYLDTASKLKDLYPSNKLELSGRDGEPIKFEVLAGLAFLPTNEQDTDSQSTGDAQVPVTSIVSEPQEIQSVDMAQTSEEDIDSDQRDIQTSTP